MAKEGLDVSTRGDVHQLRGGAVGLVGVLFLCITGSAPLAVTLFNTPYVGPLGSGFGAPGAFLFATIILTIFSVSYVQMCLKIRAAGGMYTYVSYGLGRPMGLLAGFSLLCAYGLFGASLIGGFAQFTGDNLRNYLDVDIPWGWLALFAVACVVALGYWDVQISARILGIALITEVAIIAIFTLAVLLQGGEDGLSITPLLPSSGLSYGVAPGIGVFFAFWSWVGFEAAPNYAEESRDPVRTIPIAVYFSCIAVGLFYTLMMWAVVSAYGGEGAMEAAWLAGTADPPVAVTLQGYSFEMNFATIVTGPLQAYSTKFIADVMNWLIVTGAIACASALTNAGLRYWYALGREAILPRALGRTHEHHRTPHIAIFTQGAISAGLVLIFWGFGRSPLEMYGWLAVQGVIWIVLVQGLTSLSTFYYFRREHRSEMHWFKHIFAPWFGFLAQMYVLLLLFSNLYFLAAGNGYVNPRFEIPLGLDAIYLNELQFSLLGIIGVIVPLIGLGLALYYRSANKEKYEVLGRMMNASA